MSLLETGGDGEGVGDDAGEGRDVAEAGEVVNVKVATVAVATVVIKPY